VSVTVRSSCRLSRRRTSLRSRRSRVLPARDVSLAVLSSGTVDRRDAADESLSAEPDECVVEEAPSDDPVAWVPDDAVAKEAEEPDDTGSGSDCCAAVDCLDLGELPMVEADLNKDPPC